MNPEGSLQAVWMLLCATCLSSSAGLFLNIFCASVKQANASDRRAYCLRCWIDRFAEKWIDRSVNELFFLFFFSSCFTDLQVVLSPHVQMEENQVRRHVSFISGFVLRDSFWFLGKLKDYSWRLFSTSTNGTIYSALMGSILTQAPGLGSGTGPYP